MTKIMTTTTFVLPITLHRELKTMCLLTGVSMGKFIRTSIRDKIKEVKGKPLKNESITE